MMGTTYLKIKPHVRLKIVNASRRSEIELTLPPRVLCTDNAAMIAAAGLEKLKRNEQAPWDVDAFPTLPFTNTIVNKETAENPKQFRTV